MDAPLKEHILCRLHLYAVLFALEDFVAVVPEAKQILGEENFSIAISTCSKLKSAVRFQNGNCEFIGAKDTPDAIKLHFFSERHLNRIFNQSGFALPLLTRGFLRLKQLIIFKRLSALLKKYLHPDDNALKDTTFRAMHLKILFGLILAAIKELSENESVSRDLLKSTPEGLAFFSINDDDIAGWVQWKDGKVNFGKGDSPYPPDVRIVFEDSDIALAAFHNKIINMAEIGLGRLRIEGNTAFAEMLGWISERISLYLENGKS